MSGGKITGSSSNVNIEKVTPPKNPDKTEQVKIPYEKIDLSPKDGKPLSNNYQNHDFDPLGNIGFALSSLSSTTSTSSIQDTPIEDKKTTELSCSIDDQGDTNACGTTSLSSVLNYHNNDPKKKTDHFEIDKAIRSSNLNEGGMFTSPKSIVEYAQSKGFNAGMQKNTSIDDLVNRIDKGVPSMVLVDTTPESPNDLDYHWMFLKGYEKDKEGKVTDLKLADPSGGYTRSMSVDDFNKEWKNLKGGFSVKGKDFNMNTGYNGLSIVIVPKNKELTTPDGKKIKSSDIKVPNEYDSFPGYVAGKIGKVVVVADKIYTKAKEVKTVVVGKINQAKKYVTETAKDIKDKVIKIEKKIEEKVVNTVNTIKKEASNIVNKVEDYASKKIESVKSSVVSGVSTAKSYFSGGVSYVKSWLPSW
ncbi:MAG: C39 family peptidase [Cyanobacteriota bacterium]